jgi:hypothetical protein
MARLTLGPTQSRIKWVQGALLPKIKHWDMKLTTHVLHAFILWISCLIKTIDDFTLHLKFYTYIWSFFSVLKLSFVYKAHVFFSFTSIL